MHTESDFSYTVLEWDRITALLREYASSELGLKLVDALSPCSDRETIEQKLRINSECRKVLMLGYKYPISGCSDITPALKTVQVPGYSLTAEEINGVLFNLETAFNMQSALKKRKEELPELFRLSQSLTPHEKLTKSLRHKIDENGEILDSASHELGKIRKQIRIKQDQLRKRLDSIMKEHAGKGRLQEEHVTIRGGRFVLPVKNESKRFVQGITQDVSSTGVTIFIEPIEIVERNNEISRIRSEEIQEIQRILMEISGQLGEISGDIEINQEALSQLDFHFACGQLAHRLGAEKPLLSKNNRLILRNARHPLLLTKTSQTVVPLSVTLGESFNTLVISGPNAGGKTVALKTIGLLCLMVQCGLPVPAAEDSEFPVFDRILANIGDPQSIEDDLSTFSARMLNVKMILEGLSKRDLILLDELGTGTDPQEGVSLAISIIEYLTNSGALTVVTTHHGGLKIFASESDNIENASLAFNKKNLQPTYQLSVGIPGSSYALELSKRMGIPEEILEKTRERLGENQLKVEDFIKELESRIAYFRKKGAEAADKEEKLSKLSAEYEKKLATVEKEYYSRLEDEIKLSETQAKEFNKRFERLVKELRESKAAQESIVKAKTAVIEEKARIENKKRKISLKIKKTKKVEKLLVGEIVIGGDVRISGFDQAGKVISENKKKKSVMVQMNSVRMEVNREKVIPIAPVKKQEVRLSGPGTFVSVKPEIDLRGMQADDALEAIDGYLMEAAADGIVEVRIVHGKGTGVLRKTVDSFLKRDDRILDYRLGAWGEGDTGVTIVKLKK